MIRSGRKSPRRVPTNCREQMTSALPREVDLIDTSERRLSPIKSPSEQRQSPFWSSSNGSIPMRVGAMISALAFSTASWNQSLDSALDDGLKRTDDNPTPVIPCRAKSSTTRRETTISPAIVRLKSLLLGIRFTSRNSGVVCLAPAPQRGQANDSSYFVPHSSPAGSNTEVIFRCSNDAACSSRLLYLRIISQP